MNNELSFLGVTGFISDPPVVPQHALFTSKGKFKKIVPRVPNQKEELFQKNLFYKVSHVVFIDFETGRVSLQLQPAKDLKPEKWSLTGGRVEIGQTFLEAALDETHQEIRKELKKEQLKKLKHVNGSKKNKHPIYRLYYVKMNETIGSFEENPSPEVKRVEFLTLEEISSKLKDGSLPMSKRLQHVWCKHYEPAIKKLLKQKSRN